ncbi:MAG: FAD-dependent oxidoreductase [Actinobacteria bacterium]|nr:FAD-dependent oxidoreductase [Actinomycetota bacterium]
MTSEPLRTDIIVVGAGLAGLAAAQLASRAGHRVLVLDPSPPGGRGRTDRRGDVLFNRGPHALYLHGPAHRLLVDLGVSIEGGPPASDGAGVLGERIGALPATAASLARTSLLGARGKVAVARLMTRLPRIDATRLTDVTFEEWLIDASLPDDARLLVEMLARVASYTNAPQLASADLVVGQIQAAMRHGVRYLHGGWQTLVDALASGLTIERRAVSSVRHDGAEVVVECVDGTVVTGRSCVVASGTPEVAAGLLGRAAFDIGPAVEASCLDLATSVPARPGLLLGVDTPLYLSNHCPPARLAPEGVSVVHVAHYLAAGERPDPHEERATLMAHAARAGLTADRIVDSRSLHRMIVVGGMATASRGGLPGRPWVHETGQRNVYIAGDWVGPTGHLLDASMASAQDAAARAVRAVESDTLVGR